VTGAFTRRSSTAVAASPGRHGQVAGRACHARRAGSSHGVHGGCIALAADARPVDAQRLAGSQGIARGRCADVACRHTDAQGAVGRYGRRDICCCQDCPGLCLGAAATWAHEHRSACRLAEACRVLRELTCSLPSGGLTLLMMRYCVGSGHVRVALVVLELKESAYKILKRPVDD